MSLFTLTANRACAILYSYVKIYSDGVWLLPVNVCPDVPLTLCAAKVAFEFVDINQETLCLDETSCLNLLCVGKKKYRGIIFVRTYGYLYNNSLFYESCRAIVPNLQIVDDRCLCLPSFEPTTYGADLVLYSTGHCKQIDLGGGGYAFSKKEFNLIPNESYDGTNEELIYKQAYKEDSILTDVPSGWLEITSYNEILLYKDIICTHIPQRIVQRNKLNSLYTDNLPKEIQFNTIFQNWRFNIKVKEKQKNIILHSLFQNGLFASNHYHCANRLFNKSIYPNATVLYQTTINLFNDNNYTEEMAIKTCSTINSILSEK